MATQTALILTQDGQAVTVSYEEKDQYQMMKAAVGGLIESVSYWTKNIDAYVNEEFLYTEGLHQNPFAANIRQPWLGNIVIPRMTPTKRTRLEKLGLLMCNDGIDVPPVNYTGQLARDLDALGIVHT